MKLLVINIFIYTYYNNFHPKSREISMNLNHYEIEYSNNPYEVWNSLETLPPVSPDGHDSLYEFCKFIKSFPS